MSQPYRSAQAMFSYAASSCASSSSSSSRILVGRAVAAAVQQRSFSSSRRLQKKSDGKLTLTEKMLDAGRKALFGSRKEIQLAKTGGLTPDEARRYLEESKRTAALTAIDSYGESLLGEDTDKTEQTLIMQRLMDRMNEKQAKRLAAKRWGGSKAKELEHKYSTATFKISPRKLQDLSDQIIGKPIDYAILQMQFSQKRASSRILSTLALARDHAIAKGMERSRMLVSEAWVGKTRAIRRIDIKGRGRFGYRHHRYSRLSVVLRMGPTEEQVRKKKIEKATKLVRNSGHGGVVKLQRRENIISGPWAY